MRGGNRLASRPYTKRSLLRGEIYDLPFPDHQASSLARSVVSRAEIRDLVDVLALERAGFSVERAVSEASLKDGGLTPGQLAWVLADLEIGDDAEVPGAGSIDEVREGLHQLRSRLTRMAFPGPDSTKPE